MNPLPKVKDHGTSLCLAIDWSFNLMVSAVFLPTPRGVGMGSLFLVFAVMGFLSLAYGWRYLPETKKKSLDELRYTQPQYTPMRF